MKIALVCGGPSSEHEVSLKSTEAILKNIDKSKYEIFIFYIDKDLRSCFFLPKKERLDIPTDKGLYVPLLQGIKEGLKQCDLAVLMGIHGEFAEDGRLQSLLDFHQVPYTGSGADSSALAMDKFVSTNLIEHILHLKIPRTFLIDVTNNVELPRIEYPIVVKPNSAGSSVGVYIVNSPNELDGILAGAKLESKFRYWLVQDYIQDAIEISCGCLQDKKTRSFTSLPPIEIIPQTSRFFDYSAKYQLGGSREIVPPKNIPGHISETISNLACDIHELLRCRTYSRSDFLVKDGEIYYLETNTLPGMTQASLLPQEAGAVGISFRQLIDFVIEKRKP